MRNEVDGAGRQAEETSTAVVLTLGLLKVIPEAIETKAKKPTATRQPIRPLDMNFLLFRTTVVTRNDHPKD
jgi:hypothetical protein